MKKLVVLALAIGFIACLYGCGGGASDYFGISHQDILKKDNTTISPRGQFSKPIIFPSGATINTTEDNTMAENVVVNVTETMTGNIGVNPIGKPDYIYVYDIKAELYADGIKTKATSLEKPLQLTLPTTHLDKNGVCYAGIRDNESSPWKYIRLSDDSSASPMDSAYTFELFRTGVQVALFSYNKPVGEAGKDISVAGMVATVTPLLEYDDEEKYLDDLVFDIKLTGTNLSGLSNSDLAVSIIYRTAKSSPVTIKSNGFTCSQTSEKNSDAAVSGNNYFVHTLKAAGFDATFGGEAEIKFVLDLKGISKSDFPTDFLLEVSSVDGNTENLIPFRYSSKISFKAEKAKSPDPEPEPTVYAIAYDLDGGSLASGDTNPDCYCEASDTIILKNPVKDGYTFAGWTGTGLSAATMEVTIAKGSTGDREYKATWNQNAPDTYTLTVVKGIGIATVSEDGNYEAGKEINLECTLEDGYEFASWTSDEVTVTDNKFTMPAKAVTVKANASIINYSISYDGLDGADVVSNPVTYDVTSATITLNNPTKANYDFLGWTGTGIEDGTASMTVIIPQGSTGDKTYTANWTPVSYTITYEGIEGATFADGDNPVTYDVTSADITLKNPAKAGYTFRGWSGTDLTGDENQTVTIAQGSTGDKTYTANWSLASYTITYEGIEGATFAGGENPVTYDVTSATITLNNPTKAPYTFLGWTGTGIEEGTASMTVTIPAGSTGDRAYVASWTMASVMTFTLPGGIELEMRRCPAGSFVRSGRDGYGDGNTVTITKDFYMGTYEVTNAQYAAIMESSPSSSSGANFTGDRQPVVNVSWNDIMTDSTGFISKLNAKLTETGQLPSGYKFALPTEAQWEYACRAGTTTDLNSNKNIENDYALDLNTNEVARYQYNWGGSNYKTHDVGGLASNSFGLYDMHGNVWEWCADWYGDYSSTDLTDPTGPTGGSDRVVRGGSWGDFPCYCTSWYRISINPVNWYNFSGFRLALVPVQE